ncbi:hypothetical protein GGR55DRAFT_676353 [Xylaria sp. FL0064]|nr:hypothetical protein GGR55DRAFT_676353 [Xylaria sp. FL0064]
MWLWVKDLMIDDLGFDDINNTPVHNSVYIIYSLFTENNSTSMIQAAGSENTVFYQHNLHKAHSLFASMIQTGCAGGGSEFGGYEESQAVIIRESANILLAGAGFYLRYSWYSIYTKDCIDRHTCQNVFVLLENNHAGVLF